jgi:mono/diheme cytochrome c family protein
MEDSDALARSCVRQPGKDDSGGKAMKLFAIAALLLTPVMAMADGAKDPKAERLWKSKCASCHGADGKGQTEQGKKMSMHDLTTAAWQKSFSDAKIKDVINTGVDEQKEGVHKQMDAYKDKLKPEQVDQLVAFCRSLGK